MKPLADAALRTRSRLSLGDTDALRLIDGEGDGLPGLFLEDFAGRWLVATRDDTVPAPLHSWLQESGRTVYWKNLDQQEKQSPRHLCGDPQETAFPIRENGLHFRVSFRSGYSQGIFLDQRDNRRRVRDWCRPGQTVLNTFAYTGAFSVAAAAGGATTTTLDLSQPYLDWSRDNLAHNGARPDDHYFIKGDTFHWLRRFGKQGRRFDGIVLDPPSFSRDGKGKVFRAESDYGSLVQLAGKCLAPGGWLLCTSNHRGIHPRDFLHSIAEALPGRPDLTTHPMPPDFNGEPYLKTVVART